MRIILIPYLHYTLPISVELLHYLTSLISLHHNPALNTSRHISISFSSTASKRGDKTSSVIAVSICFARPSLLIKSLRSHSILSFSIEDNYLFCIFVVFLCCEGIFLLRIVCTLRTNIILYFHIIFCFCIYNLRFYIHLKVCMNITACFFCFVFCFWPPPTFS